MLIYKGLFICGAIAQLGERLLCKQEVVGSIPSGSTKYIVSKLEILNAVHLMFIEFVKKYEISCHYYLSNKYYNDISKMIVNLISNL